MTSPISSIWIIGCSQAGKTTLAKLLVNRLRTRGHHSLMVDGDEIRAVHDNKLGFDPASRCKQTVRVKRLANWVARQKTLPVVSIVHPFEDDRLKCREEIPGYFEVYLKCGIKELIARDSKKLYLPALRGEKKNVVGVDIPYDEPGYADITFDSEKLRPEELLEQLWSILKPRLLDVEI